MLKIQQTDSQDLMLMQQNWAKQLNPLLAGPFSLGNILTGIVLKNGTVTFNHYLGRQMQGWVICDQNAQAEIFRPAASPLNSQTLTLTSNAAVTINLWVF